MKLKVLSAEMISIVLNKSPKEALKSILNLLRQTCDTASDGDASGIPDARIVIVVDQLEIRDKFNVLQASDEIEKGKPHPEIFLKTCSKLGLKPAECIVLEDSLNGVTAGKRAGCYVIAVPSAYTKNERFDIADFIAPDLFSAAGHINDILTRSV